MQTYIVISVVMLCVAYAAWRFYRVVSLKNDPCCGCEGCALKSERCGGCEGHCKLGHRMLEYEQTGVKHKSRAAALSVKTVADDRHS